ncbi:MAG: excisionase family DNA-binding protein [Sporomusaceae bacterium]|nr:excisionase family DNA-binding protein [Sporomusaceae bacterium]
MNCKCGYELKAETKFCPNCGKKAPKPKKDPVPLTIIHTDSKLSFSVKEAAVAIGVSQFLIRELIKQGELQATMIRSRIVIRRATLEQYLKDHEVSNEAGHLDDEVS